MNNQPTAADREAAEKTLRLFVTADTNKLRNLVSEATALIAAAHAPERQAAEQMAEALDWLKTGGDDEPVCFCEPLDRADMIRQYGLSRVNHTEYCDKARVALAAYRAAMKGE